MAKALIQKFRIGITAAGPLLSYTGFPIKLLHLKSAILMIILYTSKGNRVNITQNQGTVSFLWASFSDVT
jgi:hypothetical protein